MDDDDIFLQLHYEDGTWEWSETTNQLEFKREQRTTVKATKIIEPLDFSDDLDVYAQHAFQKRYQRVKKNDKDVVTLQDIKDVTLFSAPKTFLSIPMVNILHLPDTERLLRALIFYCQYYMQVRTALADRSSDQKLRSQNTEELEARLAQDLDDLRFLVAKEYSVTLFDEHFTSQKNTHNCLDTGKNVVLYETLVHFMIQIVWIALGRKFRREIDVEINRLFKSDMFNFAEHKSSYYESLGISKQLVLSGSSVQKNRVLKSKSPLINELFSNRDTQHLSGIGVIRYPTLPPRLKYFEQVLILPEKEFQPAGIHVGILGLPRESFDTMLKVIKPKTQSLDLKKLSLARRISMASRSRSSTNVATAPKPVLTHINLPKREAFDASDVFLSNTHPSVLKHSINITQKRKWIARVVRARERQSRQGK